MGKNTERMTVDYRKIFLDIVATKKMTVAEDSTNGATKYVKGAILEKLANGKLAIWGTTQGVKMVKGDAVPDAASTAPTAAEFKALLDSLREAGIITDETATEVAVGLPYAILMEDIDCSDDDVVANVLMAGKVDIAYLSALTGMEVADAYDELRKLNIHCEEVV